MDQPRPRKSTEKEQLIPNITNTYDNDDDGSFMMDGYKRTHSEMGQPLYPISNDNDDQSLDNYANDPYKVSK